jgi:hypothetical protein
VRVIERECGHYEVREVAYGKVYGWCPERVVFECECGERHVWSGSEIVCGCGTVHANVPDEPQGRRPDERSLHPWLEDYEEWRRVREKEGLRHEYFMYLEER